VVAYLREDFSERCGDAARLSLLADSRQTVNFDWVGDFGQRFGTGGRYGKQQEFVSHSHEMHFLSPAQGRSPKRFNNFARQRCTPFGTDAACHPYDYCEQAQDDGQAGYHRRCRTSG